MKRNSITIIRWFARTLSAVIILFHAMSFLGDSSAKGLSTLDIFKFGLWGILVAGLVIAWKWERTGGIIILGASLLKFIMSPILLSVWLMWIAPLSGILFYYCWTQDRTKTVTILKTENK